MKVSFQNIIIRFSTPGVLFGALLNNVEAGICFAGAASIIYVLLIAKAINESDFS